MSPFPILLTSASRKDLETDRVGVFAALIYSMTMKLSIVLTTIAGLVSSNLAYQTISTSHNSASYGQLATRLSHAPKPAEILTQNRASSELRNGPGDLPYFIEGSSKASHVKVPSTTSAASQNAKDTLSMLQKLVKKDTKASILQGSAIACFSLALLGGYEVPVAVVGGFAGASLALTEGSMGEAFRMVGAAVYQALALPVFVGKEIASNMVPEPKHQHSKPLEVIADWGSNKSIEISETLFRRYDDRVASRLLKTRLALEVKDRTESLEHPSLESSAESSDGFDTVQTVQHLEDGILQRFEELKQDGALLSDQAVTATSVELPAKPKGYLPDPVMQTVMRALLERRLANEKKEREAAKVESISTMEHQLVVEPKASIVQGAVRESKSVTGFEPPAPEDVVAMTARLRREAKERATLVDKEPNETQMRALLEKRLVNERKEREAELAALEASVQAMRDQRIAFENARREQVASEKAKAFVIKTPAQEHAQRDLLRSKLALDAKQRETMLAGVEEKAHEAEKVREMAQRSLLQARVALEGKARPFGENIAPAATKTSSQQDQATASPVAQPQLSGLALKRKIAEEAQAREEGRRAARFFNEKRPNSGGFIMM